MRVDVVKQSFPLKGTFRISRDSKTEAHVVTVAISDDSHTGIAECVPYGRYGESLESVCEQIETYAASAGADITRQHLNATMHAGAARNALDCALWDLEAKRAGRRVWELAGIQIPTAATTAYTLSLDTPAAMGESARQNADRPMLKLKLGPDDAVACVEAVHTHAPTSQLVVDANEAWKIGQLVDAMPHLKQCGVSLIEQPLAADNDSELQDIEHLIPLAADESCHTCNDLPRLEPLYDVVNIKLDKTGGLTEALALKLEAEALGLGIMVGCMMSSSLAMAPATLLTTGATVVDLDGPLWLAKDRQHPLRYDDNQVLPPEPELWG